MRYLSSLVLVALLASPATAAPSGLPSMPTPVVTAAALGQISTRAGPTLAFASWAGLVPTGMAVATKEMRTLRPMGSERGRAVTALDAVAIAERVYGWHKPGLSWRQVPVDFNAIRSVPRASILTLAPSPTTSDGLQAVPLRL